MISILMPLYNGIEFLNESLESVFKQTYKEWEVIIGINGHKPDSNIIDITRNIVSQLHQKYNYINQSNIIVKYYDTKGKPNTLNEMIKDCKYDHVAILDVDDKWATEKLEKQIVYLKDYDVVGTHCWYFGDRHDCPYLPTGDISNYNFIQSNPIINSSSIIKKELCYWEDIYGLEDYDMWLRLRHTNKKFYNINQKLCFHRIHKTSCFNNDNDKYVHLIREKWSKLN
jgi:teichuronic acid biosynthesis glycosyltransferase TuaG